MPTLGMAMVSSVSALLLLHSNEYYKPWKSNVCFTLFGKLNGNILQSTRSFFLVLEEAKDNFLLPHACEYYLFIYNDDNEETAAGYEYPEGYPKGYLHLHHCQSEKI